jgi:tricorn protease-like protein
VFDRAWVDGELAKLRPAYYGVAIAEWLVTGDESRLLRGEALRDAIVWSEGKQLSDDDSRFVRLSQEVENRAEKEANQILAAAREQAEKELTVANRKVRRRTAIGGAVLAGSLVLAAIAGLSAIGLQQQAEQLKIEMSAKAVQADVAKAKIDGPSKGELVVLVRAIRVAGRYQNIEIGSKRISDQSKSELVKAKLQTQAILLNSIYSIRERNLFNTNQSYLNATKTVNIRPAGKTVVYDGKGIIKIRSTDGREYGTINAEQGIISSLNISPDGKTIVSSGGDGTLKIWHGDGRQHTTININQHIRRSLYIVSPDPNAQEARWPSINAISPDGKIIASAGENGTIKLWEIDGSNRSTIKAHQSRVHSVNFSPNSKTIVSAGDDTIKLWDLAGIMRTTIQSNQQINDVNFSPDGKTIVSGGMHGTIELWDIDGSERTTIQSNQGEINSVNFSPDGKTIISAGEDGTVKLWVPDKNEPLTIKTNQEIVHSVDFSPDGKTIVSGGKESATEANDTIKLWNIDGSKRKTIKVDHDINHDIVNNVVFSSSGKTILATSWGEIQLWDSDGSKRTIIEANQGVLSSVSISPDDKMIVSSGEDGTIKIWNNDGSKRITIKGHQGRVTSVNISPDGQTIISGGEDGNIKIWNVDGTERKVIEANQGRVNSVNFSPDGKSVISGGWLNSDGTIKLWNVDGSARRSFKGHKGGVNSVNFSPDGKTIVSGGMDGTTRLWSADGDELATLKGNQERVNSVNFSPDGRMIVSGVQDGTSEGRDGTIKIWAWDLEQLLKLSCDWASDYLRTSPDVSDADRAICGIPPKATKIEK